ncbi:F0F1 ATP synthase subunit epsilon [bacterium]|nr:F0F1 ATP synthase subunit epsilon [bacterium]
MAKDKKKGRISLEVLTPEKVVLQDNEIDIVVVRDLAGEQEEGELTKEKYIGILANHAPMLVRLPIAPIRYEKADDVYWVVVAGGFLEVAYNKVTILSFGAEKVIQEPDIDLAITAKKRVESWLEGQVGGVGFDEKAAEADLKKSVIELYRASSHSE